MDDVQLPRLVAGGLIALTGAALVCGTVLQAQGVANDLTTIVATGIGALAGFLARGKTNGAVTTDA